MGRLPTTLRLAVATTEPVIAVFGWRRRMFWWRGRLGWWGAGGLRPMVVVATARRCGLGSCDSVGEPMKQVAMSRAG